LNISNLKKDIISTTLLTIFGRAGGMLIPFIIARYFGANNETDSFFLAYSIVFYIANIFSPSLERLIVPFINENQKLNQNPSGFISNVGWSVSVLLVIVSFFSIIILNQSFSFLSNNKELVNITFNYLLFILPILFIVCWSSLLSGVLNAYKIFSIPAISPLIRFISVLLAIILLQRSLGMISVIIGFILGELLRFSFLFLKSKKLVSFKLVRLKLNDKIIKFYKIGSYQIFVSFIYGLLTVFDRVIASYLGEGNITLYHYVERIYFIPFTLLTIGVMPVLLTYWGQDFNNSVFINKVSILISTLKNTLIKFSIIIIPIIIILILIKSQLIQILVGKNILSKDQMIVMNNTFLFLIVGLLPQTLTAIQANALIIFKKTNYLFYTSFFVLLFKPILSIILINKLNLQGLALANTITHLFVFFIFIYFINKTIVNGIK
jgi:putative peptidoglycan lipid II flippase